jgi:hypothetical protein
VHSRLKGFLLSQRQLTCVWQRPSFLSPYYKGSGYYINIAYSGFRQAGMETESNVVNDPEQFTVAAVDYCGQKPNAIEKEAL